jgi:ribonuclease HI
LYGTAKHKERSSIAGR